MKPTDEQIKEFWEWCGWEIYSNEECQYYSRFGRGKDPDGRIIFESPTIDLNNLFKYAVPKVYKQYANSIEIKILPPLTSCPEFWVVDITTQHKGLSSTNNNENDPALALFWAIKEVMK